MNGSEVPTCRMCGAPLRLILADLGGIAQTLSDFPTGPAFRVHLCTGCWTPWAQGDAVWFGPVPGAGPDCRETGAAARLIEALRLGPASLVLGCDPAGDEALAPFAQHGIPTLAARLPPPSARPNGDGLIRRLRAEGRRPDLVLAGAALSSAEASDALIGRLAALIAAQAVLAFDVVPALHVLNELDLAALCAAPHPFRSVLALERQFAAHGLRLFDAMPLAQGRLRLLACRRNAPHPERPGLARVRREEAVARLDRAEGYGDFAPRLGAALVRLTDFLTSAHHGRKRVAALGTGAPGALLLAAAGLGPDLIMGCVGPAGATPAAIPAMTAAALRAAPPDFLLVLPGADRDAALAAFADLRRAGTRFVTALPQVTVTA